MHGMCLSDAPMLRHAQQRNRVPSPPPHSQNAPNNRPGPRLFRLRRVQEAEVREGVPLHRVRVSSPRGVCQDQDQWPPSQWH